jgi:hypothetical protein
MQDDLSKACAGRHRILGIAEARPLDGCGLPELRPSGASTYYNVRHSLTPVTAFCILKHTTAFVRALALIPPSVEIMAETRYVAIGAS